MNLQFFYMDLINFNPTLVQFKQKTFKGEGKGIGDISILP